MRFTIEQVLAAAEHVRNSPDERPERLRSLRGATDPDNLYYRLFHKLSSMSGPAQVLEIGTFVGVSAAHLGANPSVRVSTVDSNPDAKRQADALGIPNIVAYTDDSIRWGKESPKDRWIDLLFVDGNHTFNQAYGEYETYRPRVAQGGLVVFDDIRLPMETGEMHVFWDHVVDPKAVLEGFHHTGIGVCRVDHQVKLPGWAEVIRSARAQFGPRHP